MMLKSVNEKVEAGRVDGVDRVPNETVDAGVDAEVAEAEGEEEEGRGLQHRRRRRGQNNWDNWQHWDNSDPASPAWDQLIIMYCRGRKCQRL